MSRTIGHTMLRSKTTLLTFAGIFLLYGCTPGNTDLPVDGENTPESADATSTGVGASGTVDVVSAPNLLGNPSFENGREPWVTLAAPDKPWWMDFVVTDQKAHMGKHSALFRMHTRGEIPRGVRIWGVVRDVIPKTFPKRLGGWYRVENWSRGTKTQYLQVVIMAKMSPGESLIPRMPLVQVAYVLTGVDQRPVTVGNRRFIFAGPKEPKQDEWMRFDFDLHADFRREWGGVPHKFEWVRVLYEARFDRYEPTGMPALSGSVYFDDLYLGDGTPP